MSALEKLRRGNRTYDEGPFAELCKFRYLRVASVLTVAAKVLSRPEAAGLISTLGGSGQ